MKKIKNLLFRSLTIVVILFICTASTEEEEYSSKFKTIRDEFLFLAEEIKPLKSSEVYKLVAVSLKDFEELETRVNSAADKSTVLSDASTSLKLMSDNYKAISEQGSAIIQSRNASLSKLEGVRTKTAALKTEIEKSISQKYVQINDLRRKLISEKDANERTKIEVAIKGLEAEINTVRNFQELAQKLLVYFDSYITAYKKYTAEMDKLFFTLGVAGKTYALSADFMKSLELIDKAFGEIGKVGSFDGVISELTGTFNGLNNIENNLKNINIGG